MLRVLCVYQRGDMPSSRIRVLQMMPHLEERGVVCEAVPYPQGFGALVAMLARSGAFDAVWLQKKLPNWVELTLWRRARAPIVFDFDDAICFRKEPENGSYASRTRAARFAGVVALSAGVTCGNQYLASLLPPRAGRVLLYPSPVPTDVPTRDYRDAHGPFRVGWIGGGGNLGSLVRIGSALSTLGRRRGVVLRVISDREFGLPHVRVENVPWSLGGQAAALAEMDAGLMPLDGDSPFDRGKCAYKILQYMAAGVVPVGSAVGMNTEVIEDRRNGRLVTSDDAWEAVLEELVSGGRQGLASLGASARSTALGGFSYRVQAERLAAFFSVIASSSKRRFSAAARQR